MASTNRRAVPPVRASPCTPLPTLRWGGELGRVGGEGAVFVFYVSKILLFPDVKCLLAHTETQQPTALCLFFMRCRVVRHVPFSPRAIDRLNGGKPRFFWVFFGRCRLRSSFCSTRHHIYVRENNGVKRNSSKQYIIVPIT